MPSDDRARPLRAGADAEYVLRALRAVWLVADEQHQPDSARRLLDLLMDGLRYGARA